MAFNTVLGNTSTAFLVYLLSSISALGINAAFQDYVSKHDAVWKRWAWAIGICMLSIIVVTIIVFVSVKEQKPNETVQRLGGNKTVPPQQVGRI